VLNTLVNTRQVTNPRHNLFDRSVKASLAWVWATGDRNSEDGRRVRRRDEISARSESLVSTKIGVEQSV
jgi:hypothetical protein